MKRLYKSRKNKVIDGVCSGIAEYFDQDPVLIRIIFVILFFLGGSALVAYIVGIIIMPRQPLESESTSTKSNNDAAPAPAPGKEEPQQKEEVQKTSSSPGSLVIGIALVAGGAFFLMRDFPFLRGFYWWFRGHFWDLLIPGILVVIGLALIFKSNDK